MTHTINPTRADNAASTTHTSSTPQRPDSNTTLLRKLKAIERQEFTGAIRSSRQKRQTAIFFKKGRIVHAFCGKVKALKALFRIFSENHTQFRFQPEVMVFEKTIIGSMDQLFSAWSVERQWLSKLPNRFFEGQLEVNLQRLKSNPSVQKQKDLMEILSLIQQHSRIGAVIEACPLTDMEVCKRLIYLNRQKFINIRMVIVKTRIVTDSTADLPPDLARKNNVLVMPLKITIGSKDYTDGIDINPDRFYPILKHSRSFPSTTPIPENEFQKNFQQISMNHNIVGLFLSKKMSLTFEHAQTVVNQYSKYYSKQRHKKLGIADPLQCEIIDSKAVSMALGLLVLEAAQKVRENWSPRRIRTYIEALIPKVRVFFLVDTLEYLERGGRIGKAKALLGNLLGVKPILTLKDGEVAQAGQARGNKNGQKQIEALIHEELLQFQALTPISASVVHADAPQWAQEMRDLMERRYDCINLSISKIGPTVGAHCGPGTVGIAFLPLENYYD